MSRANIHAKKHHIKQYPSSGAFCTPAVQLQDDDDDEDDEDKEPIVWISCGPLQVPSMRPA